ncbi:mannitol-1-phosphate 5-dehydrogenase [Streptococcus mutans]|uniref:mannitol-1-phosphate 5-dehydrogenase n=1 Tax=Streptococcus mutans TaxID=1309 RepID=UPI0002B5E692|nr:mannitol-1-phosphate 5-dehydrogenase [Streptococcus mutans]EMB80140.1 mannitol-1-phosphate 5-dehydrogenase [Streptococcus mutans 11VS1]MCB4961128.1 mannitol-1-phosphate 5-dehydrogenase [Streptococcus mutans]MCB5157113.1 mannitol-1-phosphate 5-dehydrogenase [Streptococcus mutans]MDT9506906.1 mannitol-1-phosphate 5-dehydrogenase [Streptococcus mutans]
MKKAVHFGAGNIGRGFIGQILFENGFAIDFVDVNDKIINALNERHSYDIEIAEDGKRHITVSNVAGINNKENPQAVIDAVAETELITTAIGPNILPFIAQLIAKGIEKRRESQNQTPLDIIACENMIGGSAFLWQEVQKYLSADGLAFAKDYIGFPNAAVDRIVPAQVHKDPLFVVVEPFSEWVVETAAMKNPDLKLSSVHYEENLEPFIERKLFSVNSGHATTAYTGAYFGAKTVLEALKDQQVKEQVKAVLGEIRQLLMAKWQFKENDLKVYHDIIISRFENPYIVDDVTRVARTPIRKLGYDERFIRPIRELKDRGLSYEYLLQTVAYVFHYKDSNDEQSVQLKMLLQEKSLKAVVKEVTELTDAALIEEIVASVESLD